MEYELNTWYGWNGGKCPVDGDAVVEGVYTSQLTGEVNRNETYKDNAYCFNWGNIGGYSLIAFRIIKPAPRKPREFWVTLYDGMAWDTEQQAKSYAAKFPCQIIHVREVIEEE